MSTVPMQKSVYHFAILAYSFPLTFKLCQSNHLQFLLYFFFIDWRKHSTGNRYQNKNVLRLTKLWKQRQNNNNIRKRNRKMIICTYSFLLLLDHNCTLGKLLLSVMKFDTIFKLFGISAFTCCFFPLLFINCFLFPKRFFVFILW